MSSWRLEGFEWCWIFVLFSILWNVGTKLCSSFNNTKTRPLQSHGKSIGISIVRNGNGMAILALYLLGIESVSDIRIDSHHEWPLFAFPDVFIDTNASWRKKNNSWQQVLKSSPFFWLGPLLMLQFWGEILKSCLCTVKKRNAIQTSFAALGICTSSSGFSSFTSYCFCCFWKICSCECLHRGEAGPDLLREDQTAEGFLIVSSDSRYSWCTKWFVKLC